MRIYELERDNSEYIGFEPDRRGTVLVSVLMVLHQGSTLGEWKKTIKAVLGQSLKEIEVIVVDDSGGVVDNEGFLDGLASLSNRVSLIRHKIPVLLDALCLNEAILKSKGEYIAFASEGLLPTVVGLEKTVSLMEKQLLAASYSKVREGFPERETSDLFFGNFIVLSGVVLRRDVFSHIGLFDYCPLLDEAYDWDLFLRVIDRYYFYQTGISLVRSGRHGKNAEIRDTPPSQDLWIIWEQIRQQRNKRLLPETYRQLEFSGNLHERGTAFLDALSQTCNRFIGSPWVKDLQQMLSRAKDSLEVKRVLLAVPSVDACISLYFNNIFQGANVVIRYISIRRITASDVDGADALIIARHLEISKNLVYWANELGVPCYYYTDDAFLECVKDFPQERYIQAIAALTTRDYLSRFEGVIVSSRALSDAFSKDLHSNTLICDLNFLTDNSWGFKRKKPQEAFHVAFFGGGFREHLLSEYILSALQKISEVRKVVFLCPESTKIDKRFYKLKNFEIIKIPRIRYLGSAIAAYARFGVDVQVHPTVALNHSPFKTKNCLLNATQMGAVVIASKEPPFDYETPDEDGCFVVENSAEEWYRALSTLAFDEDVRERTYKTALANCMVNNNPGITGAVLLETLESTQRSVRKKAVNPKDPKLLSVGGSYPKASSKGTLRVCRGFWRQRKYRATCDVGDLARIGILFNCPYGCEGVVGLSLYQGSALVYQGEAVMGETVPEQWWYFTLESPLESYGVTYTLRLKPRYSMGYPMFSIFEGRSRITPLYRIMEDSGNRLPSAIRFLYKAIERIGVRLPKGDLVCVDWVGRNVDGFDRPNL